MEVRDALLIFAFVFIGIPLTGLLIVVIDMLVSML
tara:strand:+ start:552 stop:656 length:105 start_codon:yes stop_codon:yes gene_type:complete